MKITAKTNARRVGRVFFTAGRRLLAVAVFAVALVSAGCSSGGDADSDKDSAAAVFSNDDLTFLMTPTSKFVALLTGSPSVYIADTGYYHETLNILINKSCAGFNFFILSSITFAYLAMKYSSKARHKILAIPAAVAFAYPLTIFANTSRIFVSVIVRDRAFHQTIGIIAYLSFLVLAYYLTETFLKYRRENNARAKTV